MMDISEVRKLENEKIQKEIEYYRLQKLTSVTHAEESRILAKQKFEESKKEAEIQFPTVLTDIDKQIKEAISNNHNYCIVGVNYYGNEVVTMYLIVMLAQILPLNGYLCRLYSKDEVTISW